MIKYRPKGTHNSIDHTSKGMLSKSWIYAVVGASNNTRKFGYKVMNDLNSKHFKVIPINPHKERILGYKTYPTLSDVPLRVDFVILITSPKVTKKVLEEIKELKIKKVWMQPGSESDVAIKFCLDNNIDCIHNTCIMLE